MTILVLSNTEGREKREDNCQVELGLEANACGLPTTSNEYPCIEYSTVDDRTLRLIEIM